MVTYPPAKHLICFYFISRIASLVAQRVKSPVPSLIKEPLESTVVYSNLGIEIYLGVNWRTYKHFKHFSEREFRIHELDSRFQDTPNCLAPLFSGGLILKIFRNYASDIAISKNMLVVLPSGLIFNKEIFDKAYIETLVWKEGRELL